MAINFQAKGFMYGMPKALKVILALFIGVSIVAALADSALLTFGRNSLFFPLLSFNSAFFSKSYLWQPFTYPFISEGFRGFTLSSSLHLLFQAILLSYFGSVVIERFGEKNFLKLFFFSSTLAALILFPFLTYPLAGPDAALYTLFVLFCFLKRNDELLLFGLIPLQVKWLFAGGLLLTLLSALAEGDRNSLVSWLVGVLTGYTYALSLHGMTSPFPLPFDSYLKGALPKKKGDKIVPLESDDLFLDRMLDKISREGEESLTAEERRRLDVVSRRKRL